MEGQEQKESARGRVRRLFIDQLDDLGFRRPGNVTAEKHKANMADLADSLAYMSDHSLCVLFDLTKSKGQGADHCAWPKRSTIIWIAEKVEPRPIEEMPNLIRWFRSRAGVEARRVGTLVETWQFFHQRKVPPVIGSAEIKRKRDDNARKVTLAQERIDNGRADDADYDLVKRYAERLAYCEQMVAEGEAARDREGVQA